MSSTIQVEADRLLALTKNQQFSKIFLIIFRLIFVKGSYHWENICEYYNCLQIRQISWRNLKYFAEIIKQISELVATW